MSDYIIYTDSSCDLPTEALSRMNVKFSSLTFEFNDGSEKDNSLSSGEFYDKLRHGCIAKTSAVNVQTFSDGFESILKKGIDILYLGMSSGLSTTYNSACVAARHLSDKYPCRKIITVDTLSTSAGLGLIVDYISRKRIEGATIDETARYAEDIKTKICHIFTVDDLGYLKKGGRISPATATVGSMLGIKPILHVNEQGKLVTMGKVRGRHSAILALAKNYETNCSNKNEIIYISHADCQDDADSLSKIINEYNPTSKICITNIGPVIGAHSGPGTLAIFFVGTR